MKIENGVCLKHATIRSKNLGGGVRRQTCACGAWREIILWFDDAGGRGRGTVISKTSWTTITNQTNQGRAGT